jgi:WD40 repeat protein
MQMLTKVISPRLTAQLRELTLPFQQFESKSNRVKGIAFHPRLTLLAASLHSGSIQLWNFQMGVLVDRFEEHDGTLTCSLDVGSEPSALSFRASMRDSYTWSSFEVAS